MNAASADLPTRDFAALFLARHPNWGDFLDEDMANSQAELLSANGLDALNTKVLQSPVTEVLDVIAEHNTGAMLVRLGVTGLQHEPSSMSKPIDFVGARGGRYYRVEVKRLAASEHDQLHLTVLEEVKRALRSNTTTGIAIELHLRESFEAPDVNLLVRHVKEALRAPVMEKPYTFTADGESIAWYTFRPDANATHPRVRSVADLDMRNVTGVDAARVRSQLKRAYDKFKICPTDDAVHLVILEVDNMIHFAQIAEALYGREYATFTRSGYAGSGRDPSGAFFRGRHSRLGALVVARRADRQRLFGAYTLSLFLNPAASLMVPEVVEALGVEQVLHAGDFP